MQDRNYQGFEKVVSCPSLLFEACEIRNLILASINKVPLKLLGLGGETWRKSFAGGLMLQIL